MNLNLWRVTHGLHHAEPLMRKQGRGGASPDERTLPCPHKDIGSLKLSLWAPAALAGQIYQRYKVGWPHRHKEKPVTDTLPKEAHSNLS